MSDVKIQKDSWEELQRVALQSDNEVSRAHFRKALATGKDIVIPAPSSDDQIVTPKRKLEAPQLQEPASPSSSNPGGPLNKANLSILAIISRVLVLQAETNSTFWSLMYSAGSKTMKIEVDMARIIGAAVKQNWDSQAAATKNQASTAAYEGFFSLAASVGSIGYGFYSAYGEGAAADSLKSKFGFTREGESGAGSELENLGEMDRGLGASLKNRDFPAAKESAGTNMKVNGEAFSKTLAVSQMANMMAQSGSQMATWQNKTKEAKNQRKAGAADSLSKQMEQFVQYYSQVFSRVEDLRQGSQHIVDNTTQMIQSKYDSMTQVLSSMFA